MPWYKDWFDTPYYDVLYAHRDDLEARQLASLIANHYPASHFPSVVDVCCGRGRHSINFARLGYNVLGLDLSQRALEIAQERAQEQLLQNLPRFEQANMLELEAYHGTRADLVINLFTSFGYFEPDALNAQALKQMTHLLSETGVFILDFLNPAYVKTHLVEEEELHIDGHEVHISRSIKDGFVEKKIHFGGTKAYVERVRLLELDWFTEELNKLGLRTEMVLGSYAGEPYIQQQSPRMLIFSRKSIA